METGPQNPYSNVVLSGTRTQAERDASFQIFKSGAVRFLICTDVAARGLDIESLPFVIMMSLPDNPAVFFHRVGRVGRQDKMGLAIALVATTREKVWYHSCPSRGKNCRNTRLKEDNGCCIWYDEPQYLADLELKLGQSIPVMDPVTFSIEGIVEFEDSRVLSVVESEQEEWVSTQKSTGGSRGAVTQYKSATREPLTKPAKLVTIYGKPKAMTTDKCVQAETAELYKSIEELQRFETKDNTPYNRRWLPCAPYRSHEEREHLKSTLTTEINSLKNHVVDLRIASRRLEASKGALKELAVESTTDEALIPLTQSIYVLGQLQDTSNVLIDIGTGYYTEKSIPQAETYFEEKIDVVNETCSKALKAIAEKKRFVSLMNQQPHVDGE